MEMKEKIIVRDLAKQYMEIATSEKQLRANKRMLDTNDLKIVRPPVLMDEIPWYQMDIDGELECVCKNDKARYAEQFFRRAIYRNKHFNCDMLIEPFFRINMKLSSTGAGLPSVEETVRRTDGENNIISHSYVDVLEDESVLEQLHLPEFTLHPEIDAEEVEAYTELLGDYMPVRLCGHKYFYVAPWDILSRHRGVEPILIDMYDRPEYLHKLMTHMIASIKAEMDFAEENMPIDKGVNLHCTPANVSGLAENGLKATWFRGMAQMFSTVSPDMFREFELDYIKPLTERFAYSYYGCCEPLDDRISMLKSIGNLRKLGVSPWANVEKCAEQIGKDYVFSRKPNPANVAIATDRDVIRRETEETVRACIKYGCPCEFVLKDISTVSSNPQNLIAWAETVGEVLDKYYGKD